MYSHPNRNFGVVEYFGFVVVHGRIGKGTFSADLRSHGTVMCDHSPKVDVGRDDPQRGHLLVANIQLNLDGVRTASLSCILCHVHGVWLPFFPVPCWASCPSLTSSVRRTSAVICNCGTILSASALAPRMAASSAHTTVPRGSSVSPHAV